MVDFAGSVGQFLDALGAPELENDREEFKNVVMQDNAELMVDIAWAVRQARQGFQHAEAMNARLRVVEKNFRQYREDSRKQTQRTIDEAAQYNEDRIRRLAEEGDKLRSENTVLRQRISQLFPAVAGSEEKVAEVVDNHWPNDKIPAIKEVRETFGLDLLTAKNMVDNEWNGRLAAQFQNQSATCQHPGVFRGERCPNCGTISGQTDARIQKVLDEENPFLQEDDGA